MKMAKRKTPARVARSKSRKTKSGKTSGKMKTRAKKQARAGASKVAKRSSKKRTTRMNIKTRPRKVARVSAVQKSRPRKKQVAAPTPQVQAEIMEIVEQPVPGIVTVTEIESVRVTVPDSDEDTKAGYSPPEEGGMAA
jgi:hypothetical protein